MGDGCPNGGAGHRRLWVLHGIAGRLLEAESRGLWGKPEPAVLEGLRQVYLETEGGLEGGE
ncbi:hypothetical protein SGFS_007980 [Streptomyces graminofaciens]|uniref:Uncharacterized protein n=1 Tax=Streptomyces graminofaciens TaxID=68212 RepID=A0ABM8HKH0_9ACTN|nr:hypothetical protein [Streptomyces graminofaciens]BBC29504.1 hypothetical protein SGFS_007980 [Streptomyces graminofaciens]